jgi:hypothetical protein
MTMHHIQSATVPSNTADALVFANIPSEFTHLQFRVFARGTTAFSSGLSLYTTPVGMSITASRRHLLTGSGSSISSGGDSGQGLSGLIADANAPSGIFANVIVDVLDWNNPNKNLTIKGYGGYDANGYGVACISSLVFVRNTGIATGFYFNTDGSWVAGSRIDLYGITTNPIATGA